MTLPVSLMSVFPLAWPTNLFSSSELVIFSCYLYAFNFVVEICTFEKVALPQHLLTLSVPKNSFLISWAWSELRNNTKMKAEGFLRPSLSNVLCGASCVFLNSPTYLATFKCLSFPRSFPSCPSGSEIVYCMSPPIMTCQKCF